MSPTLSKDHLTTGQAAVLCSVTPNAVLKWIRKGGLPDGCGRLVYAAVQRRLSARTLADLIAGEVSQ